MSERFALHPMTDLAGRLLADTTQDVALRAKYREKTDAGKK